MKLKDSQEMGMIWICTITTKTQFSVLIFHVSHNWTEMAWVSLLDHATLPLWERATLIPSVSCLCLRVTEGVFHKWAQTLQQRNTVVFSRRTTCMRPLVTSAALPQGHLTNNFMTHSWPCTEYFTRDKHPEHNACTIKAFPHQLQKWVTRILLVKEMSIEATQQWFLWLPKWEALLCMYLFAFNHSVVLRWVVQKCKDNVFERFMLLFKNKGIKLN